MVTNQTIKPKNMANPFEAPRVESVASEETHSHFVAWLFGATVLLIFVGAVAMRALRQGTQTHYIDAAYFETIDTDSRIHELR